MNVDATTTATHAWATSAYATSRKAAAIPAEPAAPQGSEAIEDPVEISEQGRLANRLNDLFGVSPRADGSIHLEDLQAHLAEISAGLEGVLGSKFRAAGIDTSRAVNLKVDAAGRVRVANDHPDKEKIEALFADDPELANEFRRVLGLQELVTASEKHLEFAAAYAENPEAAVAQFGVGSRGIETEILLRLAEGELTAVDERAA
ncbi:MAG: hypothetical protein IH626_23475 [Rhodospirillales bacterium]|nr:hypothetical protein [Rhodospirillales bacterium]